MSSREIGTGAAFACIADFDFGFASGFAATTGTTGGAGSGLTAAVGGATGVGALIFDLAAAFFGAVALGAAACLGDGVATFFAVAPGAAVVDFLGLAAADFFAAGALVDLVFLSVSPAMMCFPPEADE